MTSDRRKRSSLPVVAALLLAGLAAPGARPALGHGHGCGPWPDDARPSAAPFPRRRAAEIVVDLDGGSDADAAFVERALRARGRRAGLRRGLYRIVLPEHASARAAAAWSRWLGGVRRAEPNLEVRYCEGQQSTIPVLGDDDWDRIAFESQPAFRLLGRAAGARTATGEGVVVAVVDTGVLATHEALAGHLGAAQHDFVDGDSSPDVEASGRDDDGDGRVDEAIGHGTFVSGLVAALAPDATILPLRVLDDEGFGTTFSLADAIYWAVAAGADVINVSVASEEPSAIVEDAIRFAHEQGVVVVAAAGNEGRDGERIAFPASLPEVLGVTSLNLGDRKPPFANFHPAVSLSAPGVRILGPFTGGDGRTYARWSGTSFSAPMVAAAAALVRERHPGYGPEEVWEELRAALADVDRRNPGLAGRIGAGRLDLRSLSGR